MTETVAYRAEIISDVPKVDNFTTVTEEHPEDVYDKHPALSVGSVEELILKPNGDVAPEPDITDELIGFDRMQPYNGSYADWCIFMENHKYIGAFRVYYLKNLLDKWQWVGTHTDAEHEVGYIHLKER